MVVQLVDVGFNVVDLVLVAMAEKRVFSLLHDLFVFLLNLSRVEFHDIARFEVNKTIWTIIKLEFLLEKSVVYMELFWVPGTFGSLLTTETVKVVVPG